MGRTKWETCWECNRKMERCRAVTVEDDTVIYVCRQCWRDLNYDKYLYEHKKVDDENKG